MVVIASLCVNSKFCIYLVSSDLTSMYSWQRIELCGDNDYDLTVFPAI
jgi:hypothetical protein